MVDWGKRLAFLKRTGRLVEIRPNQWRLLAMGPTLDNYVLWEYEPDKWKQVPKNDTPFLVAHGAGVIHEMYPDVWRLNKEVL